MKLFTQTDSDEAKPRAVLLFGLGLLGGAIDRALKSGRRFKTETIPYPWGADTRDVREALTGRLEGLPGPTEVSLVWAAGVAGFMADESTMDAEVRELDTILGWLKALRASATSASVDLHLVSSAGGLFEGMRCVNADTRPAPLRPYGRGKLAQEQLVAAANWARRRVIYRPSSVFGPVISGTRRGLIPTLIENGLRRRESVIVGSPASLRDFVWADDVGRFISDCVQELADKDAVHHLVAGRPMSIQSIKTAIERHLGYPLVLRYRKHLTNAADITFAPSIRPGGYKPRGLDECIVTVLAQARQHAPQPA